MGKMFNAPFWLLPFGTSAFVFESVEFFVEDLTRQSLCFWFLLLAVSLFLALISYCDARLIVQADQTGKHRRKLVSAATSIFIPGLSLVKSGYIAAGKIIGFLFWPVLGKWAINSLILGLDPEDYRLFGCAEFLKLEAQFLLWAWVTIWLINLLQVLWFLGKKEGENGV